MASSDINNFSSSSPPHRLPTVSASQALQSISSTPKRPISTGLKSLDSLLQGRGQEASSQTILSGGVSRGEVLEIFGPPGVGKTALAMQVAVNALQSGGSVVWVDACYEIVGSRFKDFLSGVHTSERAATSNQVSADNLLDKFNHFTTPSLPHLLALLTHESSAFPSTDTSLIVVDSISTLFALAFPKSAENTSNQQTSVKKSEAAHWALGRRWAVMGDLISKISRLAATKNIAIILTSQTTTRIRQETGAVLHPAITGTAWDTGISTRIVIFRDWLFQGSGAASTQEEYIPGVRFARVMKAKGISDEGFGKIVTLAIEKTGLREIIVDPIDIERNGSPVLPVSLLKRKREEVADSQSEDEEAESDREFGWAGDDMIDTEAVLD